MKKFMLFYYSPVEAMAEMSNATAEEKEAGMKAWYDWKDQLGDHVLDLGAPLMGAVRLDPAGTESDVQSKEITGYSMIQANDLNEAKAMLKEHPHLSWTANVAIEIFECVDM